MAASLTSLLGRAQPGLLIPGYVPGATTTPPPAGSDLVGFDVAKAHLRITDSDHDAEIQSKLTHASATIREYLKSQNDPTWDATTTPPTIQAATLILLADLYERRGDDDDATRDAATWDRIWRLLTRRRDPALA